MFYRTHHQQFLFNFNNFPQFSALSHFQEMELAKEESRSGFVVETEADEFSGVGGGGVDFSVDELLDFSNGYSETEEQESEEQRETEKGKLETTSLLQERNGAVSLSKGEEFGSLHEGELSFEAEGLESLEWLSHFMDDSIPDYSVAGKLPGNAAAAAAAAKKQPCFTTPVQTKARTKRARAGLPIWHAFSSTDQSSSPPSSTSSTTSFPPPDSPTAKKKRKTGAASATPAQPRKCSHCGVTKTPQWRAGPLGAKTLCNACGVRYKSGRLLPEYRPACSPTFSTEMHSNNHRRVLEMRQKKEAEVPTAV